MLKKNVCSTAILISLISIVSFSSNEKMENENPVALENKSFEGVWEGTTSQNRPIYFRITQQGVVDSLRLRIRLYVGPYSCTETFLKDTVVTVQGGDWVGRVKSNRSPYVTTVRATLNTDSTAQGTYDGYWTDIAFACGAIFFYGPSDSLIKVGSWQASRTATTNMKPSRADLPTMFEIDQNYPNPFNPSTKIKFTLPKPENVKIEIYNLLGQKIETLLNKFMPSGYHEVEFNGQNLSSGVYLYSIEAGEWSDVKKMVLLK
jgi:hypothetical protein